MLLHSYCILEETFRGIRFVFQHTIIVKLNQKSIAFYLPIMNSKWRNGDILNMHDSGYFAISHVVGSSKHKGKQSWKRYWSACTNRPFPKKCQILNCSNPAQVGAHIYIQYLIRSSYYQPVRNVTRMRIHNTMVGRTAGLASKRLLLLLEWRGMKEHRKKSNEIQYKILL